jgi:hypothetical protein
VGQCDFMAGNRKHSRSEWFPEGDMEQELNSFEGMIAAASARIGPEYFQLPVAGADAVYRERVYCYELYHQLRCLWDDFPFSLGGEIDKSGQPHFQDGPYSNAKPDLLVHVPANMDRNLACVEVKPFGRPVTEFTSDLKKLTWFCVHANYHRGIFLVYGGDDVESETDGPLREKVQRAVGHGEEIDLARIHIFSHSGIGRPARRIELVRSRTEPQTGL